MYQSANHFIREHSFRRCLQCQGLAPYLRRERFRTLEQSQMLQPTGVLQVRCDPDRYWVWTLMMPTQAVYESNFSPCWLFSIWYLATCSILQEKIVCSDSSSPSYGTDALTKVRLSVTTQQHSTVSSWPLVDNTTAWSLTLSQQRPLNISTSSPRSKLATNASLIHSGSWVSL